MLPMFTSCLKDSCLDPYNCFLSCRTWDFTMDVEFKDLSYIAKPKTWRRNVPGKRILNSVSGYFKAGELSAIMGPSGAGKSSLLNAVSGYKTNGVTGTLSANGQPRDNRVFHKLSCYITQEDMLQPLLTVHEIMTVAAKLKLPCNTTKKEREKTIDEALRNLGLSECKKTRTENLSGGQKKRLSIALELINNPPVFFLDEPTSGLDNVTTKQVVELLGKLARQGRTIVCTIHQPSASIFALFDNVYFVSKGLCVYQGTTQELLPFLSSVGLHCPKHYNPADFVIEVTDSDEQNIVALSSVVCNGKLSWSRKCIIQTTQEDEKKTEAAMESVENEKQAVQYKVDTVNGNKGGDPSSEGSLELGNEAIFKRKSHAKELDYPTSTWFQFCTLFTRMMLQISRNSIALQLQLLHHVICALLIGIVVYQSAQDGHEMFKHVKFCMAVILFHSYTWCMCPVLLFPAEVKLLKKEYFNRWYGLSPFYFAHTLSKIPIQLFLTMLFITMVYFLNGLPIELYRFFLFSLIAFTVCVSAESVGMSIGAIFNVTNGCAIGPMVIAPFLGLAVYGFDFASQISWAMNTLMKTSFMRCGIVALVLTVYGLGREDLDCDDVYCHFKKPEVVLRMLDIDKVSVWNELLSLTGIIVIFRGICYFGLKWRLRT